MNINIQEIVDNKIKALNDEGSIKNAIEKTIESTILKSITEALSSYSLMRIIEDQVSKEVSEVVKNIGFTAYNSFIAEKVKQITEGACRADVAAKIQKTFDEMLIVKRESIKLSEIFEEYRKWICEEVEEPEKYSLERFHVKFEKDDNHGWYDVELAKEKPTSRYGSSDDMIRFTLHNKYGKPGFGWISTVYLDGEDLKKKFKFGNLSTIELLLVNITFNETIIEIDVEDEDDIDNSFDVDI